MKTNIAKTRLMELAGLIKEAGEGGDANLYAFPYEPGARFTEGQYDQITVDELRATIADMDEDLPNGVDIYVYDYTQYKPSNFSGGARAKCIVIDLDEGGFVYSKNAFDPSQLRTITLAAIRTTPIYTNRGSNSLTDRGARDVKLQQFLSKVHYQLNELKEAVDPNQMLKLEVTIKAGTLIEMFGGAEVLAATVNDPNKFRDFTRTVEEDLANWLAGPDGDEWANDGVESSNYDDFIPFN